MTTDELVQIFTPLAPPIVAVIEREFKKSHFVLERYELQGEEQIVRLVIIIRSRWGTMKKYGRVQRDYEELHTRIPKYIDQEIYSTYPTHLQELVNRSLILRFVFAFITPDGRGKGNEPSVILRRYQLSPNMKE